MNLLLDCMWNIHGTVETVILKLKIFLIVTPNIDIFESSKNLSNLQQMLNKRTESGWKWLHLFDLILKKLIHTNSVEFSHRVSHSLQKITCRCFHGQEMLTLKKMLGSTVNVCFSSIFPDRYYCVQSTTTF